MIYELREYAVRPGKLAEMIELSGEVGRRIRGDDYGKLEGYWTTEFGPLNRLISFWSFPSLDERARLRQALGEHERWNREFIARLLPNLLARDTRILSPVLPLKPPATRGHVYEMRRYVAHVGKSSEWLRLFTEVMPTRERYSPNAGVFRCEIGDLDEIVHFWPYRDLNHRAEVRAAVAQDPAWRAFLAEASPLLVHAEAVVLVPTPFSPMG
ncbi:MAG TPA: NIPSNAP family protein [Thermodesulfobacteriota bacterium]